MHYLNTSDLQRLGTDWRRLIGTVRETVHTLHANDFSQPQKPYLRYKAPKNRIIAMPAYVGGQTHAAGIKWIASFPDNLQKGLPRAHSVTILNDADSGRPFCVINSALVSILRTAGVSGLVIQEYLNGKANRTGINVGITGLGPIGRQHVQMLEALAGDAIAAYYLYDIREVDVSGFAPAIAGKIRLCRSWEQAFDESHIFITCTVAERPYINRKPVPGSLQLNVSLRDYQPDFVKFADLIIVDDWNEVCRENTDIEVMHKVHNLQASDCALLADAVCRQTLRNLQPHEVAFFNPMGMAVFDIAVANYYYQEAVGQKVGVLLPD